MQTGGNMELIGQLGLIAFGALLTFLFGYCKELIIKKQYIKYLKYELNEILRVESDVISLLNEYRNLSKNIGGKFNDMPFKVDEYFVKYNLIRIVNVYKRENRNIIVELLTDYIQLQKYVDTFMFKYNSSEIHFWKTNAFTQKNIEYSWAHKLLESENEYMQKKMISIYKKIKVLKEQKII